MASQAPQPKVRREPTAAEFTAMRESATFKKLRGTYRNFTFPMTVAFFFWYIGYVLTAVFAPGFMATQIGGGFNVGLVFGLLQFVTTFAITWVYVRYANKNIEPQSAAIRTELEG